MCSSFIWNYIQDVIATRDLITAVGLQYNRTWWFFLCCKRTTCMASNVRVSRAIAMLEFEFVLALESGPFHGGDSNLLID